MVFFQKIKMLKLFNESGSQWRILANLWMALTMIVFTTALFFRQFTPLTGAVSIIYVAILSIYAGTKECNRWSHYHRSRHLGELTIIIWTVFLVTLIIGNLTLHGQFAIPQELIAVYTGVLAIFAVTQRSKDLFEKHGLKLKGICPVCGHDAEEKKI